MNSQVIRRGNRGYFAETGIQDGTERSGPCGTLDEALKWCKSCEKIMNGNKIKKRDIPVYEEISVIRTELKRIN